MAPTASCQPPASFIHPLGNTELSPEDEKALRRRIVEKALQALQTEVVRPTVFAGDDVTVTTSEGKEP